MKIKFPIFFLIAGVLSQNAYAGPFETTPRAYETFCGTGAQKMIADLDKDSGKKVDEIKKMRTKLNDLSARKNLISGILQIKDEFNNALASIASDNNFLKKDESAKINDFKILLRTSLSLSAVSMLAKANQGAVQKNSVAELCDSKDSKVTQSNLCKYVSDQKTKFFPELSNLNQTLKNVNNALAVVVDADSVKKDLTKIYESIPLPIAPDKILGDLITLAPSLVEVFSKNDNRNAILECLKDSVESCKSLISNKDDLKTILTAEMTNTHKEFTNGKLDDFLIEYNKVPPTKNEQLKALILKNAPNDLAEYKNACGEKIEQNNAKCLEFSKTLIAAYQKQSDDFDADILSTNTELKKLVADNSLEISEKMKQYVAKKYLRTCSNATPKDIVSNLSCPCLDANESGTNLPGEASELGRMSSTLSGFVGRLKTASSPSSQRGELGPFSKDELRIYSNYCNNSSAREKYNDICDDIYSESNKIANQKESKEWDEFNKKYWVEYNPKNSAGYSAYEKKSNVRIFGEGLAQSVNSIFPIWMGNFQLGNQIDYMTNQALYMKQLNYMNNPTSPWMLNNPYFQGNYFSTTGAFTGFGTTTTPTTNGFNF